MTRSQDLPGRPWLLDSDDELDPLCLALARRSYCAVPGPAARALLLRRRPDFLADWPQFQASWNRLPVDGYMADGGRYRQRRYATLRALRPGRDLELEAQQPHYQSLTYNRLHGDIERHYAPIEPAVLGGGCLTGLLDFGVDLFSRLSPYSDWHIEVHQFRIVADRQASTASPTPEGRHRDGVSYVLMAMIGRANVHGGESFVHGPEGALLHRLTLTDPLDLLLINDERVVHGVSDIAPDAPEHGGHRDVLVATFRYIG